MAIVGGIENTNYSLCPMGKKIIIVPDIHGRRFWETVLTYKEDIVFLGDYLDPYNSEGISREAAIVNFRKILLFAKSRPNVTLLLGNHDLSYVKNGVYCRCRTDYDNYEYIQSLFLKRESLFSLAYECEAGGKRFLFSHAGITPGWHAQHIGLFPASYEETLNAGLLNQLYREEKLTSILSEISRYRGGANEHGSLVWADIREYLIPSDALSQSQTIQIVGHSQTVNHPVNLIPSSKVCDVDTRECYYIDDQGTLRYLANDEEVPVTL